MLDYAAKVTHEPWAVATEDIDYLRAVGFDERAILDICQLTAYYAYVNRLADGLGIKLEDFWGNEEDQSV